MDAFVAYSPQFISVPLTGPRREPRDPRGLDSLSYDRRVHLGVILPNFDQHASPDGVRAVAEAAEELGFDSVWATEHIIVGPEAVDPYGRVLDPLCIATAVDMDVRELRNQHGVTIGVTLDPGTAPRA